MGNYLGADHLVRRRQGKNRNQESEFKDLSDQHSYVCGECRRTRVTDLILGGKFKPAEQ